MLFHATPTLSLLSSYTFHSMRAKTRNSASRCNYPSSSFAFRPLSAKAPVDDTQLSSPELLDNSLIEQSDAKFRLQSQNIGLTYSQIGEGWTLDFILSQLQSAVSSLKRITIKRYLISLEKHKDGGDHSHVVISFSARPDIRSSRFFDLTNPSGKICHPRIERLGKNLTAKVIYAAKDDNYISEGFNVSELRDKAASKKSEADFVPLLLKIVKEKGLSAATDYLEANASFKVLQNVGVIQKKLKDYQKLLNRKTVVKADYSPLDFDPKFVKPVEDYLSTTPVTQALYMSGPSGTGKSSLAQAVAQDKGRKPLLARSPDSFADRDISEYTNIILDDFTTGDLGRGLSKKNTRTRFLQFIDPRNESMISRRYEDVVIPKGMPRIIINNESREEFLKTFGVENDPAFLNRLKELVIDKDIRINKMVINVTNNILISPETKKIPEDFPKKPDTPPDTPSTP